MNSGQFKKGSDVGKEFRFKKGVSASPQTQFKSGQVNINAHPEGYVRRDDYGWKIKKEGKWVRMMHPDPPMDEVMKMAKKLKTVLREQHRELARRNVQAAGGTNKPGADNRAAETRNSKSACSVKSSGHDHQQRAVRA